MSKDQKKDLTKIEDLSEYLHEEDPETDAVLDAANASRTDISVDVSQLEDDSQIITPENNEDTSEDLFEETPDIPEESEEQKFEGTDSFNIEESIFDDQDVFESPLEDVEEYQEDFQSEEFSTDENEFEEEIDFSNSDDDENDIFDNADESDDYSENNFSDNSDEEIFAADGENDNSDDDIFASDGETEDTYEEPEDLEASRQNYQPEPQNQTVSEILVKEEPLISDYEPIQPVSKEPEKFKDLNEFAKNISYGDVAAGGNPPYSLILKNIRFKEDAEDILIILRDHNLADDSNEETFKEALDNGSVLISQISEYSAIYLAHKFRRFNVDIQMGLSEELHPSTTYDKNEKGLISKHSLGQNEREHFSYPKESLNLDNILLATTPTLENHIIRKYLSIVSTHKVIEETELMKNTEKKTKSPESFDFFDKNEDKILENISFGLDEVYKELANELKQKCLKHGGNAVVGINFQLTPLFSNPENKTQINYKITATGNVVWVLRNGAPIERL